MSTAPNEDHSHCDAGLFHNADPIHTHRHCKNCWKMARAEGPDSKLHRCSGCLFETYCSRECQKAHWKKGHKDICTVHKAARDSATRYSGDVNAWSHLVAWKTFHDTTLANAVLACFLLMMDEMPDMHSKYFLFISLFYRNDTSLPVERCFEVRGTRMVPYSEPLLGNLVFRNRKEAIEMGRMEKGSEYWGTGAYFLSVNFTGSGMAPEVPYWKHFSIEKRHARATPSCKQPLEVMKHNIHEGLRLRFCCGREENTAACCCGGWTHEKSGRARRTIAGSVVHPAPV